MRIERWYWLPIFCVISLLIHASLTLVHGSSGGKGGSEPGTIEVSFERTLPPPPPKPVKPEPKPGPKVAKSPRVSPALAPAPKYITARRRTPSFDAPNTIRPVKITRVLPISAPKVSKTASVSELPERIIAEAPDTSKRSEAVRPAPRIRIARNDSHLITGGGSPSPSPIPGGNGGLKAPEAPPEDVLYTGGGRGGTNLPHVAPRIGGGGGRSILSVRGIDNPLGDTIPDDKPGIGPGSGGGQGTGHGGGVGFGQGSGIGTRPGGSVALGTLHHKPGAGIGAADSGSGIGTKAPGGGRNTGSELPGTGGTGNGYGRGHGTGIGDGIGDGPPAKARGVPFGDVVGLLGGVPGKGGSEPTRGGVFGPRPTSGGGGAIHIIYALDISGSMRDGNKIGKAQQALIKALGELHPTDTFNIILFKRDASTFAIDSVPATLVNVANARSYVLNLRIGDGTNISSAMDLAFGMNGITHIYLMSDGEPNGGINDFNELRRFIHEKNTRNVKIITLALGLGENFPGIRLLRGIAEDNNGSFTYINLNRVANPAN